MSKVEAAYLILREYDREMTYKEIIDIAIKRGLIVTKGKTPDQTLRVDIMNENKRRQSQGKELRFNNTKPKFVSLY
ncbi:MAG TPA: hypothetical protein GX708_05935 [Gallicola sp.]|nr:hypothetical protein [Gallicola sp.]